MGSGLVLFITLVIFLCNTHSTSTSAVIVTKYSNQQLLWSLDTSNNRKGQCDQLTSIIQRKSDVSLKVKNLGLKQNVCC